MSINDYYRRFCDIAKEDILSKDNEYILSVNTEDLVKYYISRYCLPLIEKDETREVSIDYEPEMHRLRGIPISRRLRLTIKYPIVVKEKLDEVLRRQSSPYFPTRYSLPFREGYIVSQIQVNTEGDTQARSVQNDIETIEKIINQKNANVSNANSSFETELTQFVEQKKVQIESDNKLVDSILIQIPYTIVRKGEVRAEPVALTVREAIKPIYPDAEKPTEPYLEVDKINAVIEIITNAGRGFEVTPHVFNLLEEEYLRDIILGFLNTIFSLGATGETFLKNGKTDIHIKIDRGSIFSAECKKWDGPKLYSDTIDQLFNYLIWRQNYGVIITFSNRVGFTDVMDEAKRITLEHSTTLSSICIEVDVGHFVTEHEFPDDPRKRVTIHHLLFNLYPGT